MSSIDLTFDEMDGILGTRSNETVDLDSRRVIKVVEESEWVNDHKSQYMYKIIEVDGKFYSVSFDRQGSDWTDWYYGFDQCREPFYRWPEVKKIEVTKYEWVKF